MRSRLPKALAVTAALSALLAMTTAAAFGQTLHAAPPTGPAAVPGEIVVGFRSGVDPSERAAARSAAEVRAGRDLLVPDTQVVRVISGQSVPEAIAALERRRDVRYAEPNWIYQATSTTPDDPLFGSLWGLTTRASRSTAAAGTADADIDAPEAWNVNRGSVARQWWPWSTAAWRTTPRPRAEHVEQPGRGARQRHRRRRQRPGRRRARLGLRRRRQRPPGLHTTTAPTSPAPSPARGNNGLGSRAWLAGVRHGGPGAQRERLGQQRRHRGGIRLRGRQRREGGQRSLGGPAFSQAMRTPSPAHPEHAVRRRRRQRRAQNNDTAPAYPCSLPGSEPGLRRRDRQPDALASSPTTARRRSTWRRPASTSTRHDRTTSRTPSATTSRPASAAGRCRAARGARVGDRLHLACPTRRPATTSTTPTGDPDQLEGRLGARTDCALKFPTGPSSSPA